MKKLLFILPLFFLLASCSLPLASGTQSISVTINSDSTSTSLSLPKGSTVQQAVDAANIKLSNLDRVDPVGGVLITEGMQINVIRVVEEFEVVESVLPFENQTVKNESMPNGQKVLIQPGVNGKASMTYRVLKENGVAVSRTIVKSETVEESKPEIVMVGVQSPFVSQPIEGRLAYITSSNAWIMEGNTGNRRPVVTSGDLDGRIFTISPDRNWLLFSRSPSSTSSDNAINSLWLVNLQENGAKPVALGVENVVHFAEWIPGREMTIAYSTVEPRSTPPGWQANNDLVLLQFDAEGFTKEKTVILEQNSGGIYGWWGTFYSFSPDGSAIAYARPDSVGLVDQEGRQLNPLINLTPYQTGGDWAWIPGLAWSPDGRILFTVQHGPAGSKSMDETSSEFDLSAIVLASKNVIRLYPNSGMFSYPEPSPNGAGNSYQLSVLTSILPDQSGTSKYDLRLMDRDGSNIRKLYPGEGVQGLSPQQVVWSPGANGNGSTFLCFLAQGNIMLVETSTGDISQVSGDGTVSKIDWK
jgi:hypothetical protein